MRKIVEIYVTRMTESCQRTTYFVTLVTDEGMRMTPESFATGSIYTDFKGLSVEEARDRALMTASEWGDFLEIKVQDYEEDGVVHEPSMTLDTYTMKRELGETHEALSS